MVVVVEFGPLGLSWGAFSGSAAVGWNSAHIVAALGGKTPWRPALKR